MVCGGLLNAEILGLDRLFSYAGFASAYVKEKDYHLEGLFPTGKCLKKLLTEQSISTKVDIPDLYPGDVIKLPGGAIEKAFINQYTDTAIKEVTDKFYDIYGNKNECISYKNGSLKITNFENWLEYFLSEFHEFSIKRVQGPDAHFDKLLGKDFSIEIALQNGES